MDGKSKYLVWKRVNVHMNNIERLLSLDGHPLCVMNSFEKPVRVQYDRCEVKTGCFLVGACGVGATFEDACDDYFAKISGKTLVFNAGQENEERVRVL